MTQNVLNTTDKSFYYFVIIVDYECSILSLKRLNAKIRSRIGVTGVLRNSKIKKNLYEMKTGW